MRVKWNAKKNKQEKKKRDKIVKKKEINDRKMELQTIGWKKGKKRENSSSISIDIEV